MNRNKKRLDDLERKLKPEERRQMVVIWSEEEALALEAEGHKVIRLTWPEDDHKPLTRTPDKD